MADTSVLRDPLVPFAGKDPRDSFGSNITTLIYGFTILPLELNWCHFPSMCTRSSCFVKEEKYD